MNYFICDIDNCFADDSWRAGLIDWHLEGDARYRRYNAQCHKDPVGHLFEFGLMELIATPVFFTGRSEEFRKQTLLWADEGLDLCDPLIYMRPLGYRGTPVELKRGMLEQFMKAMHVMDRVIAGFDDLPEVLEMYKEYDIPTVQLKIHDLDFYNCPAK